MAISDLITRVLRIEVDPTQAEEGLKKIGASAEQLTDTLTAEQKKVYEKANEYMRAEIDGQLSKGSRLMENERSLSDQVLAMRDRVDKAKTAGIDKEIVDQEAKLNKIVSLHQSAMDKIDAQEKQVTKTIASEYATQERQAATHSRIISQEMSAAMGRGTLGFGREMMQGSGVPMPFMGGNAPGMLGMGAGLALGIELKSSVQGVIDLSKAIHELQLISGGSTEAMSHLIAEGKVLGTSTGEIMMMMNRLKTEMVNQPAYFKELGIATKDAAGNARPIVDVFNDVRATLAGAKQDADTMQVSTQLLGRSSYTQLPFLLASKEAIKDIGDQAQRNGLILDQLAVEQNLKYAAALDQAGRASQGLSHQLGEFLLPKLAQIAEAAATAGDMIGAMVQRTNKDQAGVQGIPLISGIGNFLTNAVEIVTGKVTEDTKRIDQTVTLQEQVRKRIEDLIANPTGIGTDQSGKPELPKLTTSSQSTQVQAERDIIAVLQDEIQAQRDQLQEFNERKQGEIQGLRDIMTAEREKNAEAVTGLQETIKAEAELYAKREQGRQDTIAALREQITAIDAVTAAEQQQATLEAELHKLKLDQSVQIYRSKGETEEQYQQKVFDHNQKIKDDEKRVADERKKIAVDAQKKSIEEQIKEIEELAKADARATQDHRLEIEKRIKAIQDQEKADQKASDTKIKAIEAEVKAHGIATNDIIKNLTDQVKEHEKAIKAIEKAWAAGSLSVVTDLKKIGDQSKATAEQMKADAAAAAAAWAAAMAAASQHAGHQGSAQAGGGTGQGGAGQNTTFAPGGGGTGQGGAGSGNRVSREELLTLVEAAGFQGNAARMAVAVALAESGGDPLAMNSTGNSAGVDRGLFQLNSVYQKKYTDAQAYDPAQAAQAAFEIYTGWGNSFNAWAAFNNGSYAQYMASGGSLYLDEPHLLMNARTRNVEAVMGESGTERLTVQPTSGPTSGGGQPIYIKVDMTGVPDAQVAQRVVALIAEGLDAEARLGFRRRP